MKIEVSDDLFSDLAKKLETTPENIVKVFLEHAKNLPYSVLTNAIQKTSSLDTALEQLMTNAEPAYLMGALLHEIIGDHNYYVESSDLDLEGGTFWFEIEFLEDDEHELETMHLQFGNNAVITGTFSIKDVLFEKDQDKLTAEIESIIESISDEEHTDFDIDWIEENWASITVRIYSHEILNLPKVAVLEEIAKKIKSTFQKFDERNNLK